MVIFETWPASLGRLPTGIGRRLAQIADGSAWSDHMSIDLGLAIESQPGPGFVGVWAVDHSVSLGDNVGDNVIAYGQISAGNDVDLIEVGIDDAAIEDDERVAVAVEMFDTTVDAQAVYHPDRAAVVWTSNDSPVGRGVVDRARERGFITQRVLLQMSRALPAATPTASTRPFDPTRDVAAILDINNAAFAGHPEQGDWTTDTFARRSAEDWFDPDGIRLIEADGEVAGFCWVKLHRDAETVGEIYVVAVHPNYAGRGLGTQLMEAGMEWMVEQSATRAMLYVQADNAPAVALYERLGYTTSAERVALISSAARSAAAAR